MDFAYVTFVNKNETYINLMKSTIKSVEVFSRYPIIVYCVDIPTETNPFIASERCILRNISISCIEHKNIYYMKKNALIFILILFFVLSFFSFLSDSTFTTYTCGVFHPPRFQYGFK